MKKNFLLLLISIMFLTLSSCQKMLIGTPASNTPATNFEELWKGYDQYYGLFSTSHLNWDSVYNACKPKVYNSMSNRQLYDLFSQMLSSFNNIHVFLQPTTDGLPRYESSKFYINHKVQEDFKMDVVKNYIPDLITINEKFHYGVTADNIGYLHFGSFDMPVGFYNNQLFTVMNKLKDTKGIIVDIRDHEGGDDKVSKYISGLFASNENLFMITKKKNGPQHENFTAPQNWYVKKEGAYQYTKPVILLTSKWSASAAETFTWAMKTQSHLTQMGDTTAGGFSDILARELPNGWLYFIPVGDYRNSKGESEEGKGIVPDLLIVNKKQDIDAGVDKVLQAAISRLK